MLIGKKISVGYFLNMIKWDVIAIFCYASLSGALDHFSFLKSITIPLAVSALIGTLLSLLLAFRTAQSYERWWEARIVWGAIVNDSRTLIRQLLHFLPPDDRKSDIVTDFAVRQSVWCFALADNLRRLPYSPHVAEYAIDHAYTDQHLPNQLLTVHAEKLALVANAHALDPIRQTQLDSTLARLTDAMGKCERIKNTVFPRSYSMLLHFLIYVLMTILPFGLDDQNPFVEVVMVTLVPVLLIAIEKTAIVLQDPFENRPTDTPMTTLSINIEKNLMEMAGEPAPERESATIDYYQL
ncbi:hypothetical protein GCM10010967_15660 [Dyadobacter beijingensis]|uniref:Bestrophin, RFP-TM, chloride channel n=1 Tax=Dyadobacter beijingensis TaxID=365489 RepID=A0ABQ2HN11_9BACT|nr:bestrophin family ion channel [Dyadobacter beijingensis]GGM84610.1 hypothetical protein GCM10010967_15660 [Dyadobacter beijingensis]